MVQAAREMQLARGAHSAPDEDLCLGTGGLLEMGLNAEGAVASVKMAMPVQA